MARPPRSEFRGAVDHVYAHSVDSQKLFRDDHDRGAYLELLADTVRRFNWRCLSYCLMDTHIHLIIETPDANLGQGMCKLHGDYARRFNKRYSRRGHVFESRYGAVLVESEIQLNFLAAYIALNPVAAGICNHADEWPWSSHAATLAGTAPMWLDDAGLLAYFGTGADEARRDYAETVERARLLRGLAPGVSLG